MGDSGLTITITQASADAPVQAEVWCPGFVDHTEHDDVADALEWAEKRIEQTDPFEEYDDAS